MRIYTAFDKHYASPALAMMRSLAISMRGAHVTILAIDMDDETKRWVAERAWLSCDFVDVSAPTDVGTSLWFTPSVYARFEGPRLIDDDRLLYIDPDTLIVDDLTPLATIDLDDMAVGAVQSLATPLMSSPLGIRDAKEIGLNPEAPYLSGGVLLIDRQRWLEENVTERTMAYATSGRTIRMADQEALNAALNGAWARLHLRWNQETGLRDPLSQHRYMMARYFDRQEISEALTDPAIIHFNGPNKPWKVSSDDRWSRRWMAIRSLDVRGVVNAERTRLKWPIQA